MDESEATKTLMNPDSIDSRIMEAASIHDIVLLGKLCPEYGTGGVNYNDGSGYSALHAAIASSIDPISGEVINRKEESAEETVRTLLANGAAWNDVDAQNETPGCLAFRLGLKGVYDLIVDAGVRAELLFAKMDEYELLADDEEEALALAEEKEMDHRVRSDTANNEQGEEGEESQSVNFKAEPRDIPLGAEAITNLDYLSNSLDFSRSDRVLDAQGNGVMMSWEDGIMKRTVEILCSNIPKAQEISKERKNFTVLNIGHGMGIIDDFLQERQPSSHHIVEAHPDVIAQMRAPGGWLERQMKSRSQDNDFSDITIHEGTWQSILPKLVSLDMTFDVIYFDTFAESYQAFKTFYREQIVALLKPEGRWSFFHGLGADRRVCYDVYTKVVELDLFDAGFDVSWEERQISEEDSSAQWVGVKRRYWDLNEYRLPLCTFLE